MEELKQALDPYRMHLLAIWSATTAYLAAFAGSCQNCSFFNPFCVWWDTSIFWKLSMIFTCILLCYTVKINPWTCVIGLLTVIVCILACVWN